jgi:hypothetical protein
MELRSRALLERPLGVRPLNSFLAFYVTRRLSTEFTRALHLFVSWARPIQSTSPCPTSPRSLHSIIQILYTYSIAWVVYLRLCLIFCNKFIFYGEGLLAPHPTSKLEDRPLSFVHGCLFNIFTATLHSWRPFLHLQPEDAPCCGDKHSTNWLRLTASLNNQHQRKTFFFWGSANSIFSPVLHVVAALWYQPVILQGDLFCLQLI